MLSSEEMLTGVAALMSISQVKIRNRAQIHLVGYGQSLSWRADGLTINNMHISISRLIICVMLDVHSEECKAELRYGLFY